MLVKILSYLSYLVAIPAFSDISSIKEITNIQLVLFVIITGLTIYVLYQDWKIKPIRCKNDKVILKYMKKIVSKTGRIVIFTRDMSWAQNKETESILISKASGGELTICVPKKNDFIVNLEIHGAEVIDYPEIKYTPSSRFTIVHYGRLDSKLAVGRTNKDGEHIITEFENGIDTTFNLAEDLVNLLKEISKKK